MISFQAAVKSNNCLVEENRVGIRRTFDVLQGQQDLFASEVSLVNGRSRWRGRGLFRLAVTSAIMGGVFSNPSVSTIMARVRVAASDRI
jgi:hypothetical protein